MDTAAWENIIIGLVDECKDVAHHNLQANLFSAPYFLQEHDIVSLFLKMATIYEIDLNLLLAGMNNFTLDAIIRGVTLQERTAL